MSDTKNSQFMCKFLWLCFGGISFLVLLIGLLYVTSLWGSGLVLLYVPWLVILSSIVGLGIWLMKYRHLFEALLVYLVYLGFGFAFIIMAPIAIDRSLSSFIFFYSVEHDGFPMVNLSQGYKDAFFEKRFDDAVKGSFLVKDGNVYKPTLRAKVYYGIFYPLGMATNMLENYKDFAQEVDRAGGAN